MSSSTGEVKLERRLDVTVSRRYVLEAQVTDGLHLAQVTSVVSQINDIDLLKY